MMLNRLKIKLDSRKVGKNEMLGLLRLNKGNKNGFFLELMSIS